MEESGRVTRTGCRYIGDKYPVDRTLLRSNCHLLRQVEVSLLGVSVLCRYFCSRDGIGLGCPEEDSVGVLGGFATHWLMDTLAVRP
jgi:hypothetical protein